MKGRAGQRWAGRRGRQRPWGISEMGKMKGMGLGTLWMGI